MGTKYRVDANRALPSSPAEYAAKNKRQYNEELGLLPSNSNVALRKQRNNRRIQSGTSRISDTDSDLNENLADAIFGGKSSKLSKNKQRRLDTSTDDNSGDEYGGDDFDESILMNDAEFEAKLEELLAQEDPVGENAPRGPRKFTFIMYSCGLDTQL
jgi:hypothetical protein